MNAMNYARVVFFLSALTLTVSNGHALEWVEYDGKAPDNAVVLNEGREDAAICRKDENVGILSRDGGRCISIKIRGSVQQIRGVRDGFEVLVWGSTDSYGKNTREEWVEYEGKAPNNAISINEDGEDALICRQGSYVGLLTEDTCYSVRKRPPFRPKTFPMNAPFEVLTETEVDIWAGTYSPGCNSSDEEWVGVSSEGQDAEGACEFHSGNLETYLWPNQQNFGPRVDKTPHYAFIGKKQYAFYLDSSNLFADSWWYWYLTIYEGDGGEKDEMIYQGTFKQSDLEEGKEHSLQIEINSDDDYPIQVHYLEFDAEIGELVVETETIELD
tara:strand:+ start:42 stop:1025 length:984 start_codon:yes stop_codon:yes gene_type:complete